MCTTTVVLVSRVPSRLKFLNFRSTLPRVPVAHLYSVSCSPGWHTLAAKNSSGGGGSSRSSELNFLRNTDPRGRPLVSNCCLCSLVYKRQPRETQRAYDGTDMGYQHLPCRCLLRCMLFEVFVVFDLRKLPQVHCIFYLN